jgi:hypothetical protein
MKKLVSDVPYQSGPSKRCKVVRDVRRRQMFLHRLRVLISNLILDYVMERTFMREFQIKNSLMNKKQLVYLSRF